LQDPPPGASGTFQELYKITEYKEDIFKNERWYFNILINVMEG